MNFYKRHLGDYAKDAGHLTMLEHGAYTLLLDRYYTTEKPIPSRTEAYRVCRARTAAERDAVDAVLAEFFKTDGEAFLNGRAEEEIAKASHQRTVNQELGKRGGRPKLTDSETHSVIDSETDSVPIHNPSQTPDSRLQGKEKKPSALSATPTIPCPYDRIVALYHDRLPTLPKVKLMPKARQAALRKLWGWVLSSTKSDNSRRATTADEALTWIAGYFTRASENDFLMGRGTRSGEHANWRCDIDFLLTDKGMRHVIEKTLEHAA